MSLLAGGVPVARATDVGLPPAPAVVGPEDTATGEAVMGPAAQAQYDRGLRLYQAKDYALAIAAFEAGFALEPRREFLFAGAQARRLAGDCRGAVPLYQRFLALAPPAVQVNATHIALGRCAQQLAAERARPLAPPPAPAPPPPPAPWWHDRGGGALLVGGVVGLGVGAGFLAASYGARSGAGTVDDFDRRWSTVRTRWNVAMVGLVGGGALAAGGLLRYAWVRHHQRADASLTIVPGGLALQGSF